MKKTFLGFLMAAALVFGAGTATMAQQGIAMPAASPAATVSQKVGLTDVTVTYSRPLLKGRTIGSDLATYGKIWRTGANAPTKITFSDEVSIQGNKIPAGDYALYTIPNKNEWTVIVHKNLGLWGDAPKDYKESDDVARFTVKPQQNPRSIEAFTINFTNLKSNAADVELLWGNTVVPFTIETEVDSKVMAQIQEKVINGTNVAPGLYASAASYYFTNNKDLKQAAEWMKKANEKEPRYWNLHTQAKIQAQLKDYKGAIKTAEKSLEMAKAGNDAAYISLNEKAIAEWKKMK